MNKLKLLPILGITATVATLGSTLVSCNDDSSSEELKFSVKAEFTAKTTASVKIEWDLIQHSLEFDDKSFNFTYGEKAKPKEIDVKSEKGDRPYTIEMMFSEPIEEDIEDGVLSFKYKDNTARKEDISGEIRDIKIEAYPDFVLDTWDSDDKKWLLLTDVSIENNTKVKVKIDLSKFDIEKIQYPIFCIGEFEQKPDPEDFTINAYYDGQQISESCVHKQATQPEKEGKWELDVPIVDYTLYTSKKLTFEITYKSNINNGWLSFQNGLE